MEANKMLEHKLKSITIKSRIAVLAAVSLIGITSCEEEPKGPSEDCCAELNCKYDQKCDGDGYDCYCRSKTCCEKIGCTSYSDICKTNEWDSSQCKCEQKQPNIDKGY